jgi:uncharacterized protein (TIGR03000 family)
MRKLLLLAAVAGGLLGAPTAARAEGDFHAGPFRCFDFHRWQGPKTTSVTWPSVNPPGWYSDTYRYRWYYPWYAYYNFSMGPYANWMAGGGYAGYAYHGPAGYYNYPLSDQGGYAASVDYSHYAPQGMAPPATDQPKKDEKPKKDDKPKSSDQGGKVTVTLPADAKLLFNGVAASGNGAVRTFQTPPLAAGQNYRYELTAEVVRDGRTERTTGTVIVRAGETAAVTLSPTGVTAASK